MPELSGIGSLPLIETSRKSLWYLPVSREGPYTDPVVLMRHFLRKALMSALQGAIQEELMNRAEKIAKDAVDEGYTQFDCWLDASADGLPIKLRFLNADKGLVITRRLSHKRLLAPFDVEFHLDEAVNLEIMVQSRVLNTMGIVARYSSLPSRKTPKHGGGSFGLRRPMTA